MKKDLMKKIRVGSLFSGIGTPEEALKKLKIPHIVKFACDIDKNAKIIYLKNHNCEIFYDNIKNMPDNIGKIDLVIFGFPCQPYSIASNTRRGLADIRGQLIFEAYRIIKNLKPKYFIAENVPGFQTLEKGKILRKFLGVISNDILTFPSYIIKGYSTGITNYNFFIFEDHIDSINKLKGRKDFFYYNYSEFAGRKYFTDENAMLIDNTRYYINKLKTQEIKNFLIYCSLEAITRVLNTTGVQAAFLKQFKARALNCFKLRMEKYLNNSVYVDAFPGDIIEYLKSKREYKEDILYIDPPYNERQYGPNYHLYETFVKYDNPVIKGKTGLRDWQNESKSNFCSKKTCLTHLKS